MATSSKEWLAKTVNDGAIKCYSDEDISSSNVLIQEGVAKITDFGLSSVLKQRATKSKGAGCMVYLDPLSFMDTTYRRGKESDVFSLGVILWEISSAMNPCGGCTEVSEVISFRINGLKDDPFPGTHQDYIDLYSECLTEDFKKRPSCEQIYKRLEILFNSEDPEGQEQYSPNEQISINHEVSQGSVTRAEVPHKYEAPLMNSRAKYEIPRAWLEESELDRSKTHSLKNVNLDKDTPTYKKLDDLYALIDGIETCMFTTRRSDGSLVSRAMQTRSRIPGAAIYFVTNNQTDKLEDMKFDPHVNCAYIRGSTEEWVSVAGTARIVEDRDMIKQLWTSDCKKWFGDLGDNVHDGSASDPRVCLVLVEPDTVHYTLKKNNAVVELFKIAKEKITGEPANTQTERAIDNDELRTARGRI
ncbi:5286_t:CDS:2 [Paraglomus occultum]|uniref:5286_t:CDS:1 n=1 Tax=Paraglomus occultum TaxID=144539 RepID=A0A9N9BH29_9GLOM|nr:5286_t:CDS:2 [Paraglomus occultum]